MNESHEFSVSAFVLVVDWVPAESGHLALAVMQL